MIYNFKKFNLNGTLMPPRQAKPTLEKRKRFRDLENDNVKDESRHKALLASLQSKEISAENISFVQTGEISAQIKETPVRIGPAPRQMQAGETSARVDKHFNEVNALVKELKAFVDECNEQNTSNSLYLTPQQLEDALKEKIIDMLHQRAKKEMMKHKKSEDKILLICQALADDIRSALTLEGIDTNPLYLRKKHNAHM